MFYQECERLANEKPELSKVIEKIDELLRKLGPGSMLRPEKIAFVINERESQIEGIFNKMKEYGLLRLEKLVECPKCENLMPIDEYEQARADGDEFECSQCSCDLTKVRCNNIQVYRLRPRPLATDSKTRKIQESNPVVPKEISEKLTDQFLKDVFCNTPLLRYYSRDKDLLDKKPFAGKRILIILHFLRDLIPFMEATFALGLEPINATLFYKSYPYPQKEAIGEWLKVKGCQVLPISDIKSFLDELRHGKAKEIGEILIIEDGGFIVPKIHSSYSPLIGQTIGAVEQTTRGIMNAKDWEDEQEYNHLNIPVISVAGSNLKAKFEPPYIAKAAVNNISRMLPNKAWNGKEVAVLGYGAIGEKMAEWLTQNGAHVTVFDRDHEKLLAAQQKGVKCASSAAGSASNKFCVIGSSGRQSVDSSVISMLRHDTYLVSASSEQYEIDMGELSRLANVKRELYDEKGMVIGTDFILPPDKRCIHLLANGYPINFWGAESMPEEASDLIMTLIFLASVELSMGNYNEPGINQDAVNDLAGENKYGIAQKFLQIYNR